MRPRLNKFRGELITEGCGPSTKAKERSNATPSDTNSATMSCTRVVGRGKARIAARIVSPARMSGPVPEAETKCHAQTFPSSLAQHHPCSSNAINETALYARSLRISFQRHPESPNDRAQARDSQFDPAISPRRPIRFICMDTCSWAAPDR